MKVLAKSSRTTKIQEKMEISPRDDIHNSFNLAYYFYDDLIAANYTECWLSTGIKNRENNMLIGRKNQFAIETEIFKAYSRLSFRALGFFVIYIHDFCFGIRELDATMLACSYDEVVKRINNRGRNIAKSLSNASAIDIAIAVQTACYLGGEENQTYFDLPEDDFIHYLHNSGIWWAPDGDEAFDDGGNILQFDEGDQVRIIGFINQEDRSALIKSVRETRMDSDVFYSYLTQWVDMFDAKWHALPKEPV